MYGKGRIFLDSLKTSSLTNGKVVRIVRPFERVIEIRVKRVPRNWKEDDIRRVFSFYGAIRDIYQEKFKNTIDPNNSQNNQIKEIYRELKNGNWKVKMVVKRAIPSTLVIGGFKIEIFYRGKTRICWKCRRVIYLNHPVVQIIKSM